MLPSQPPWWSEVISNGKIWFSGFVGVLWPMSGSFFFDQHNLTNEICPDNEQNCWDEIHCTIAWDKLFVKWLDTFVHVQLLRTTFEIKCRQVLMHFQDGIWPYILYGLANLALDPVSSNWGFLKDLATTLSQSLNTLGFNCGFDHST